jgi:hypothetical protein
MGDVSNDIVDIIDRLGLNVGEWDDLAELSCEMEKLGIPYLHDFGIPYLHDFKENPNDD